MPQTASVLLTIALLWSATAVAPGPNFFLTTRTALLKSRATGVQTALGIACGSSIWGLCGFFGIHTVFTLAPWLYLALKVGGSIYLIAIGGRYLVNSFRPVTAVPVMPQPTSTVAAVRLGMVTSLANPQSALSTASLFAATLPPHPSLWLGAGAITVMTAVAAIWYGFVACVLTMRPAAAAFARLRRWIDRVAGLAFLGFGTRLALER
ncbi:MAG TPA: LysE family transporter [Acetobacteraceae bacterium]|nr:LysE family transporter [Acetobacteraceae bacterium]